MMPPAQRPFIERVNEAALIEAALQDAGRRTIVVHGPAGVGKSSLLNAIVAKQAASGALVGVVTHIQDAGSSVEGLIRALETMVSAGLDLLYEPESALHGLANLLGASVDVLADVGEGPFRRLKHYADRSAPLLEAEAAETRFADAVVRVLLWLQGFQAPIILLLEDWGRAEAAIADLYRRVCKDNRLRFLRVLASERLTEPLALQIDTARIPLPNFSPEELREFVRTRVDPAQIDSSVIAETLIAIDAANPLRAEQYLRLQAGSANGVKGDQTALFDTRIRAAAGLDVMSGSAVQASSAITIVRGLALMETAVNDTDLQSLCAIGAEYEPIVAQLASAGLIVQTSAGIQSDVTDADTKAELAEASRAAAARGRLLTAISHELRAPLQGAKAVLELGELDKTEARLALACVVDQLTVSIDDLHQLAIGEVSGLEMRSRVFDLSTMLQELGALWRPLLPATRQLLVTSTSTPPLSGDSPRLRQAIGNLLSNAIKYGKGDITLSASLHPLREATHRLHIFVDDEGTLLSEDAWARLFEPFKRGEVEGTSEGLGLGLSIARRIAIALEGDLSVTHAPSGGTRFCISATCSSGFAPSVDGYPETEIEVLLVEDERVTRNALAELLRRGGARVTASGTASDAYAHLEGNFQLIILDANLPDGSGTGLARRAREKLPHATLAIISGGSNQDIGTEASELGAVALRKPIDAHDLRLLLSRSGRLPDRTAAVNALQTLVADLCEAERLGDHKEMRFIAHKIAGLSAQFRFREVHDYATSIEHLPTSNLLDAVRSLQRAASKLVTSAS